MKYTRKFSRLIVEYSKYEPRHQNLAIMIITVYMLTKL